MECVWHRYGRSERNSGRAEGHVKVRNLSEDAAGGGIDWIYETGETGVSIRDQIVLVHSIVEKISSLCF